MLRDSNLITALIFQRRMCLQCIARKTRLSESAAHTALEVIRRAVPVECADEAKCVVCGKATRVFAVNRPD